MKLSAAISYIRVGPNIEKLCHWIPVSHVSQLLFVCLYLQGVLTPYDCLDYSLHFLSKVSEVVCHCILPKVKRD